MYLFHFLIINSMGIMYLMMKPALLGIIRFDILAYNGRLAHEQIMKCNV